MNVGLRPTVKEAVLQSMMGVALQRCTTVHLHRGMLNQLRLPELPCSLAASSFLPGSASSPCCVQPALLGGSCMQPQPQPLGARSWPAGERLLWNDVQVEAGQKRRER
eukprot:CAMPEP_0194749016 /NCGR_PEP_ID=MMETSP0323_2-20130528/3214_1 /TAXON_ID=2866 ORGANISM="Crypthecodinium cohnii, Strain Seligo" /NCGR_SAMPLE_ID=MMETSP0323_2 /ASSEMBLY_ACC=CAM_ASM_000346 /LENGTH=107 /DNA_ID=CAMNT_0039663785 /DNA_START=184 /DNA_END=504 /DNA_ORIENTATION=-